ncbi:DRTGG domain-containing protein [Desulfotruncus alcoholivorax]|uniref:DRTGG domain-containing protein n=1 Tax=Desulfotruncus alcoholivorax TaxID=265477 RepID=UPI00283AA81C|nr:DRTGG domain-containing protein [Desulfotruncus alcoholivorax]
MLNAEVISGETMLDLEVSSGFGCDLISDSLCFSRPECLLITGLTNIQIIRVADMIEARAIMFVRGKKPGQEIIRLAEEKKLPLLVTNRFLFESCGLLYQHGLRSS